MDIKFSYTILYVQDVPKTMYFYKSTFEFEQKLLTPENDYGEVISGETTLAFASLELGKSNFKDGLTPSTKDNKPFGFEIAFTTSEVEKIVARAMQNGASKLSDIEVKPWGQTVVYIRDINGFIIEICSPMTS